MLKHCGIISQATMDSLNGNLLAGFLFPGEIKLEPSKLTYIETAADEGKVMEIYLNSGFSS